MPRRGPIVASEFIAELTLDPLWVARSKKRDRQLAEVSARLAAEERQLVVDLRNVALPVHSVWDLVNTNFPYEVGIPVLLAYLLNPYSTRIREGIIRALAVRGAREFAWDRVLGLLRDGTMPDVRDALFVAISGMALPQDLPILTALILDKRLGLSRGFFLVRNLRRSRSQDARATLLLLKDDPVLGSEIQSSLGLA